MKTPATWLRLLLPGPGACAAVCLAWAAAGRLIGSDDLLFNLAQGRWIVQHNFPAEDPFSFTASAAWFPHEWGFGVLVYGSEQLLGGAGPVWLCAFLLSLTALLAWKLLKGREGRPLAGLGLAALVLGAQSWMWSEQRAYLASLALLALALYLLASPAGPWWRYALLVPLGLFWANLHGGWPLGVGLAGSWALGRAWEKKSLRAAALPALLTAACLLAAAVSPAGFANLVYPFRFLLTRAGAGIWEWQALDFSEPASWCLVGLAGWWLWVIIRLRSPDPAVDLPALVLLAASLSASRHGPFAALALAAAIRRHLDRRAPSAPYEPARPLWLSRFAGFGGGPWLGAVLLFLALRAGLRPQPLVERLDPDWFPVQSLERLCREPAGRVLNRYHLGGAVQALCGPRIQVFIDGRNDCFPPAVHRQYEQLVLAREGWPEVLRTLRPDYILWSPINHGRRLEGELRRLPACGLLVDEPAGQLYRCRWEEGGLPDRPSHNPVQSRQLD